MRHLCVGGAGLARLAAFTVRGDLAAGRLRPIIERCTPGDLEEGACADLGQGSPLPARIRVLLDFLAERARVP